MCAYREEELVRAERKINKAQAELEEIQQRPLAPYSKPPPSYIPAPSATPIRTDNEPDFSFTPQHLEPQMEPVQMESRASPLQTPIVRQPVTADHVKIAWSSPEAQSSDQRQRLLQTVDDTFWNVVDEQGQSLECTLNVSYIASEYS